MTPTLIGLIASITSADMMLAKRVGVQSRFAGSSGVDGAAGRRATSHNEERTANPASAVVKLLEEEIHVRTTEEFRAEWARWFHDHGDGSDLCGICSTRHDQDQLFDRLRAEIIHVSCLRL